MPVKCTTRYRLRHTILPSFFLMSCGGGSDSGSDNIAPTASNLTITDSNGGHALPGDTLQGNYNYSDIDGDSEGATQIAWLRNNELIEAASNSSYTLTEFDDGQTISLRVTPVASTGTKLGAPVISAGLVAGFRTGENLAPQDFYSAITDWTYAIEIYLPAGYEDTDTTYPIIYKLGKRDVSVDLLDAEAKKILLVSIGIESERRARDYLLPGAYDYYDFLTIELIPYIESQYRVDSDQRALVGHSYGGSFTAAALFFYQPDNRYFSSYVISDGAFSNQADQIIALEQQLATRTDSLPVDVVIGAAALGNPIANEGLNQLLVDRAYLDLNLHYFVFDARHEEAFELTFRQALDVLYP
jgi:hypothetical protein